MGLSLDTGIAHAGRILFRRGVCKHDTHNSWTSLNIKEIYFSVILVMMPMCSYFMGEVGFSKINIIDILTILKEIHNIWSC